MGPGFVWKNDAADHTPPSRRSCFRARRISGTVRTGRALRSRQSSVSRVRRSSCSCSRRLSRWLPARFRAWCMVPPVPAHFSPPEVRRPVGSFMRPANQYGGDRRVGPARLLLPNGTLRAGPSEMHPLYRNADEPHAGLCTASTPPREDPLCAPGRHRRPPNGGDGASAPRSVA